MIDDLTSVISNEAKKLLQASEFLSDEPLTEAQLKALEALCRCAKALRATEKEDPPDDLEDESDEELLGKVGLPTGGTPGGAWPKGVCVCKHPTAAHSKQSPYINQWACVFTGCNCPFFRQGDEVTAMLLEPPTQT